jgi:hypothetical protein
MDVLKTGAVVAGVVGRRARAHARLLGGGNDPAPAPRQIRRPPWQAPQSRTGTGDGVDQRRRLRRANSDPASS